MAQTPLPGTVEDFLTLAFQKNCAAIATFQKGTEKVIQTYTIVR